MEIANAVLADCEHLKTKTDLPATCDPALANRLLADVTQQWEALDASGWELRKALRLFSKCNLALNEWLNSPSCIGRSRVFAARCSPSFRRFSIRSRQFIIISAWRAPLAVRATPEVALNAGLVIGLMVVTSSVAWHLATGR
jgi:hypothetical protein